MDTQPHNRHRRSQPTAGMPRQHFNPLAWLFPGLYDEPVAYEKNPAYRGSGSASPAVIAKRRAANKRARAQRRINRKRAAR